MTRTAFQTTVAAALVLVAAVALNSWAEGEGLGAGVRVTPTDPAKGSADWHWRGWQISS